MKTVCVHAACLLGLFFLLLFWGGATVCALTTSRPQTASGELRDVFTIKQVMKKNKTICLDGEILAMFKLEKG